MGTFESYDQQAQEDKGDAPTLEKLQSTTLSTVERQARRQKVYSKFPEDWSIADKLAVYRALAMEPWKTIPDEIWMKQQVMARKSQEQVEAARKNRPKKMSREQRMKAAERERLEAQAAEKRAQRKSKKTSTAKGSLTSEEIEQRRQQRRQERRAQGKENPQKNSSGN